MREGFDLTGNIQQTSTGYLQLARGTSAQRPTANNGMLRYNTDNAKFEFFQANSWSNIGTITSVTSSASTGTEGIVVSTANGSSIIGLELSTLTVQNTVSTSDYVMLNGGSTNYRANVITIGSALKGIFVQKIGDVMSGSLSFTGGQVLTTNGTVSAPSHSFSNNPSTGIYQPTTNTIAVSAIGNAIATFDGEKLGANASVVFNQPDAILIPKGTTAQRPSVPLAGMIRWNTTLLGWDTYDNNGWDTWVSSTLLGSDGSTSEPMHFVYDAVRTKFLSTASFSSVYIAANLATNDYVNYNGLFSADVGNVMPYNGTITGFTAYISNANRCIRSVSVYTGTTENTGVFIFGSASSTGNFQATKTNVNLNFAAGDLLKIRMRFSSGTNGNAWTNLNLIMYYKWRI